MIDSEHSHSEYLGSRKQPYAFSVHQLVLPGQHLWFSKHGSSSFRYVITARNNNGATIEKCTAMVSTVSQQGSMVAYGSIAATALASMLVFVLYFRRKRKACIGVGHHHHNDHDDTEKDGSFRQTAYVRDFSGGPTTPVVK